MIGLSNDQNANTISPKDHELRPLSPNPLSHPRTNSISLSENNH
ncbi:hypothetical protein PL10110_250037 [Planktothrix agardhii]|nr:hypothetical protein PL10110_250037 [Planktothrix agardhii]